jgi:hypothetical protein
LLGGALGERFGLRAALAITAAGYFCAFFTLLLSPLRKLLVAPAAPIAVTEPR